MAQNIFNTPSDLLVGIKAKFYDALTKVGESQVLGFTFQDRTENDSENYVFADVYPQIKEWLGARGAESLKAYNVKATARLWEITIKELRTTIRDGKAKIGGILEMTINNSVNKFKRMPDKLVQEILAANTAAFDGTALFSTTRTALQGTSAINNLHTGTGVTLATVMADLASAKTLLRGMKDRNNEPLNTEEDFAVYIPTHLVGVMENLQNAELVYTSALVSNPHKGTFKIIINYQQSTSDNDWYLINLANPFKPFIFLTRQDPEWDFKDDKEDRFVKYLGDARYCAIPGNPTAIVKVNN